MSHDVPFDPDLDAPREYRLAPLIVARLVGAYLLVLAVLLVVVTVAVGLFHGPPDVIVLVLLLGLVGLFGTAAWVRGRAVVRLDEHGYRVRLVRGAGVKDGAWADVEEAVAAHPRDIACLVLRRSDGRTTTIPVGVLAGDRDVFARDVAERLSVALRRRI